MIRLPSERLIRFHLLHGTSCRAVGNRLEDLGYLLAVHWEGVCENCHCSIVVRRAPRSNTLSPLTPNTVCPQCQEIVEIQQGMVLDAILRLLAMECAEVPYVDDEPHPDALTRWQLLTPWEHRHLVRDAFDLARYPEIRRLLDVLILSRIADEKAHDLMLELAKYKIKKHQFAMYRSLFMDISAMSPWDVGAFLELHKDGDLYGIAYRVGYEAALSALGYTLPFDAEKQLAFMCQASGLKMQEVIMSLSAEDAARPALTWMHIFAKAVDRLGPSISARKLIEAIHNNQVAVLPLDTLSVGLGISTDLLRGGRIMPGDAVGACTRLHERYGVGRLLTSTSGGADGTKGK